MNTSTKMIGEDRSQTHVKIDRNEIAPRAYELWCVAGRPAGRDLEFWLQAEAGLLAGRVILITGALTFLPSLALGPIVEHLALQAGTTY